LFVANSVLGFVRNTVVASSHCGDGKKPTNRGESPALVEILNCLALDAGFFGFIIWVASWLYEKG
jgi:hypothetical protein